MPTLTIDAQSEVWPLKEAFTISRGAKTAAHVVVATVREGEVSGRGEAVPYARYGETVESVLAQIKDAALSVSTHGDLAHTLKPGAAHNALDCAFWDLAAKRTGRTVATLAGLPEPEAAHTAYTISLDTPETMAGKATGVRNLPILKLKLGGIGDADRMRAVRFARPDARLLVDANEAWTPDMLPDLIAVAAECKVEVIEQPLAATADEALRSVPRLVPICADESVHTGADLARLKGLYDAVNIKLDKAGGLTGAMALQQAARQQGLKVMIGSMVATSLAVAPAMLLARTADWIDLDGPLLLARDREPPLHIENGRISPPERALWG
ncbi:MAG: N-acetyl-D-Glu racemase DgcA [Hyphomicrobium sp.]|uniref:N-acetyl-D-Glu racemase DgcA n=1 Tax=Hyphomicrobium sp. TaxID=82 RepID=UPI00356B482A